MFIYTYFKYLENSMMTFFNNKMKRVYIYIFKLKKNRRGKSKGPTAPYGCSSVRRQGVLFKRERFPPPPPHLLTIHFSSNLFFSFLSLLYSHTLISFPCDLYNYNHYFLSFIANIIIPIFHFMTYNIWNWLQELNWWCLLVG